MVKKLVTINVEDKELKSTTKSVVSKKSNVVEKKEVENFGVVEINNSSAVKKVRGKSEKGFEKNVSSSVKKSVKAQTSKVDDYFDFSFRKTESEVKQDVKCEKAETVSEVVNFDSEVDRIIMVARLGSLFDCDKRMINA